jgi:hypothetical protein
VVMCLVCASIPFDALQSSVLQNLARKDYANYLVHVAPRSADPGTAWTILVLHLVQALKIGIARKLSWALSEILRG